MTSVFDLHYLDQIRDQIKAIWEIESGVDPELVDLNVGPLGGADLFDFLYPNPKRINSGRLNDRYLELWYKCEQAAGWVCDRRFRQTIADLTQKLRERPTPKFSEAVVSCDRVSHRILIAGTKPG